MSESLSPEHEPTPGHRWAQEAFEAKIDVQRAQQLFAPAPQAAEDPDLDSRFLGLAPPIERGITSDLIPPQTQAGREAAMHHTERVLRLDAKFAELTAGQLGQISPADLVDELHTNPELRLAAGMHFLGKLDQLASTVSGSLALPDRVARNDPRQLKTPSKVQPKAKAMLSREYVAVLCLAKLDGTYDPSADTSDPIEYDMARSGDFLGQHRYAADLLLDKYQIYQNGDYYLHA